MDLLELKNHLEEEWEIYDVYDLIDLWDQMIHEEENNIDNTNRIGKFRVNSSLIINGEFDLLSEFFSNFAIFDAHYNPTDDVYQYIAKSPLFRKIRKGEDIPNYEIMITTVECDCWEVEARETIFSRKIPNYP